MEAEIKRPVEQDGPGNELNEFTLDFTDLRPESPGQEPVIEIEQSLLDAIVTGGESFAEAEALGLKPEDFSTETHRLVYGAMTRLHEKCEGIDALSLSVELKGGPERPDGGDWSQYIVSVLGLAVPCGGLDYPIRKIREFALNRKLAESGYRLSEAAEGNDSEGISQWSEAIERLGRERAELESPSGGLYVAEEAANEF